MPKDKDRYGRIVAVCLVGNIDLNGHMVREGWAVAYRRFNNVYVGDENAAKQSRKGMWRGEFVVPWKWRTTIK
ncbi:MAG: thermonuclease family protein [Rhodospirillaceae bacterium]|nr:thermonuclease family protein [Rhodospirillales bacterium]MBT4117368.1 thermonuclease family protein [Rhodospirillaceae bacterium]MBT5840367.1 thermonuclease family protein [Rhodospirillaceae bacterium]MBT7235718.1 thermonuclease family protein [Rhodospirillaceae bacterium]MBT7570415.1 thermonuclease family protein [Rhodospirillaceae bacterium]